VRKPPAKPVPPGGGGYRQPAPGKKPAPKPVHPAAGGYRQPPPAAKAVPPGGGYQKPAPKKKPKPRRLAAPGENCVLDACYALTGCRPDLDGEDGVLIPDALEMLAALGLITGFEEVMPCDPEWLLAVSDGPRATRAGLILGVDLPGPHAVLAVPGGWHSWGELYDPAAFPDAVIEEAWAVTW